MPTKLPSKPPHHSRSCAVGDAAPHAAAEAAHAARLRAECRSTPPRASSRPRARRTCCRAPRRTGCSANPRRCRRRRAASRPLTVSSPQRIEIDPVGRVRDRRRASRGHPTCEPETSIISPPPGRSWKRNCLGRRIENDEPVLRLIADVEAALLVGSHQRAGAGRLERSFLRAIGPAPLLRLTGLRIEPPDARCR